jgi:hypothetical protein
MLFAQVTLSCLPVQKAKKSCSAGPRPNPDPPPSNAKSLSVAGRPRKMAAVTSTLIPFKLSVSLLKLFVMKYNDLIVRNGRLINISPNSVSGIQKAIQIKKNLKRSEKVSMMSEAMYQAEVRAEMRESMMPDKEC